MPRRHVGANVVLHDGVVPGGSATSRTVSLSGRWPGPTRLPEPARPAGAMPTLGRRRLIVQPYRSSMPAPPSAGTSSWVTTCWCARRPSCGDGSSVGHASTIGRSAVARGARSATQGYSGSHRRRAGGGRVPRAARGPQRRHPAEDGEIYVSEPGRCSAGVPDRQRRQPAARRRGRRGRRGRRRLGRHPRRAARGAGEGHRPGRLSGQPPPRARRTAPRSRRPPGRSRGPARCWRSGCGRR